MYVGVICHFPNLAAQPDVGVGGMEEVGTVVVCIGKVFFAGMGTRVGPGMETRVRLGMRTRIEPGMWTRMGPGLGAR